MCVCVWHACFEALLLLLIRLLVANFTCVTGTKVPTKVPTKVQTLTLRVRMTAPGERMLSQELAGIGSAPPEVEEWRTQTMDKGGQPSLLSSLDIFVDNLVPKVRY